MTNQRFAEYTTSGAFALNLSRNQVFALGLVEGGTNRIHGTTEAVLERKGLIEPLLAPDKWQADRVEHRPTRAGLLTLGLLREAGLSNGASDPVAHEFDLMREELKRLRDENAGLLLKARAAMARKQKAELAFRQANALRHRRKPYIGITLRDPIPHVSDEELVGSSC